MSASHLTPCCNHCKEPIDDLSCSNCKERKEIKRINSTYITSEISSILNLEKGIFYTIKGLFVKPGKTIQEFLFENRKKIAKPITFLFFCSFISILSSTVFEFEDDKEIDIPKQQVENIHEFQTILKENTDLIEWLFGNKSVLNIITAFFIAFWISIIFKKHNYNIYELLIVSCYTLGIITLFDVIFDIIAWIIKTELFITNMIISIIYSGWSIGQFFKENGKGTYLKASFPYILGVSTALVGALIVIFSILLIDYLL